MSEEDIGLSLEEEAPKEEPEQTEEVGLSLGDEEAPKEVSRPDDVPEAYEFEGESDQFNELVGGVAKEIGLRRRKRSALRRRSIGQTTRPSTRSPWRGLTNLRRIQRSGAPTLSPTSSWHVRCSIGLPTTTS